MIEENNPKDNGKTTDGRDNVNGSTGNTFSSENQPTAEQRKAGNDRYKALNRLKKDMFKDMIGHDIPKNMISKIKDKVDNGDVKEALDLLKIITPKDIDIKSDGEALSPTVIVNTQLKKQGE